MKLSKIFFLSLIPIIPVALFSTSCSANFGFVIDAFTGLKQIELTAKQKEIIFDIKPTKASDQIAYEVTVLDESVVGIQSTKENEWKITAKASGSTKLKIVVTFTVGQKSFPIEKTYEVKVSL